MLLLGIICLILGAVLGIPALWTVGIILTVIGVVLVIFSALGRTGGRRLF